MLVLGSVDTQIDAMFEAGYAFSKAHHFWYLYGKFPCGVGFGKKTRKKTSPCFKVMVFLLKVGGNTC